MRFIKHGVAVSLSQPRKNGDSSVVLRVTCGGKRDDLHSGICLSPKQWNEKKGRVRHGVNVNGVPYNVLNDAIDEQVSFIHGYFNGCAMRDEEASLSDLKARFNMKFKMSASKSSDELFYLFDKFISVTSETKRWGEPMCVAVLNFLGLSLIARIGVTYALGIAFIAGILNIIPYVGPIIGEAIGVLLCMVLKYGTGVGLDVNIWVFALIVLAIMLGVQLIDNFVLQSIIYSTSIQATPLEIFIVMLITGHIGGILGMLAAIPAYTVIRVIAGRFFYDKKFVQRLMPDLEKEITK